MEQEHGYAASSATCPSDHGRRMTMTGNEFHDAPARRLSLTAEMVVAAASGRDSMDNGDNDMLKDSHYWRVANPKMPRRVRRCIDKFIDETVTKFQYARKSSSLSTTRVRQRLCQLMGTDVIRLNDRRYFKKLSERLQEEYELAMDKQEQARSQTEEERLRKLMLEGIIKMPTDYRSVVHSEHKHRAKKKKRKIRKTPQEKETEVYLAVEEKDRTIPSPSDEENEDRLKKDEVVTQVQKLDDGSKRSAKKYGKAPASGSSPTKADRGSAHVKDKPEATSNVRSPYGRGDDSTSPIPFNDMHARPPHHSGNKGGTSRPGTSRPGTSRPRCKSAKVRMRTWDKRKSPEPDEESWKADSKSLPDMDRQRPRSGKYSQQESPRVTDLKNAQTVNSLYNIAEDLVVLMGPQKDDSRRVQVTPKKKKPILRY